MFIPFQWPVVSFWLARLSILHTPILVVQMSPQCKALNACDDPFSQAKTIVSNMPSNQACIAFHPFSAVTQFYNKDMTKKRLKKIRII